MSLKIRPAARVSGSVRPPGDKSISHRAMMFGALAEGTTRARGLLLSQDCLSTMNCLRALGANIALEGGDAVIEGAGLHGLREPERTLDAGNSGTTARLLCGLLSGQSFFSAIQGDASLHRRPMRRVVEPLTRMGADIRGRKDASLLPLAIRGGRLVGIHYESPVASAQVKSAALLAGLYAEGKTSVAEPEASRDHSERMLRAFGAGIRAEGKTVEISPPEALRGIDLTVPADPSSGAFFAAAAALCEGGDVLIEGVSLNPTRLGFYDCLERMGALVDREEKGGRDVEPWGDIRVRRGVLKALKIEKEEVPNVIDEIPLLALLASRAEGATEISGAGELRHKESDRIRTTVRALRAFGAEAEETEDGLAVRGGANLRGARVEPEGDHRIAMMGAVAGLVAAGETEILEEECMAVSFPGFAEALRSVTRFK